jgi:hypothetical protein
MKNPLRYETLSTELRRYAIRKQSLHWAASHENIARRFFIFLVVFLPAKFAVGVCTSRLSTFRNKHVMIRRKIHHNKLAKQGATLLFNGQINAKAGCLIILVVRWPGWEIWYSLHPTNNVLILTEVEKQPQELKLIDRCETDQVRADWVA